MKNNKTLKLASGLLILCLITTCIIGTTLAKYTAGSSASDTASVAKWGLQVSASGTLFGKAYGTNGTSESDTIIAATASGSVSADRNVMAPGTKNDVGLQISAKGTPEVAYTIEATIDPTQSDIVLRTGIYGVMVEAHGINEASDLTKLYTYDVDNEVYEKVMADATYSNSITYYMLVDVVDVTDDYYPVTWKLSVNDVITDYDTLAAALTAIQSHFTVSAAPNATATNITCTLTWEWKYDNNTSAVNYANGADTILANIGTGAKVVKHTGDGEETPIADADYCLTVAGGITVTATQVD